MLNRAEGSSEGACCSGAHALNPESRSPAKRGTCDKFAPDGDRLPACTPRCPPSNYFHGPRSLLFSVAFLFFPSKPFSLPLPSDSNILFCERISDSKIGFRRFRHIEIGLFDICEIDGSYGEQNSRITIPSTHDSSCGFATEIPPPRFHFFQILIN